MPIKPVLGIHKCNLKEFANMLIAKIVSLVLVIVFIVACSQSNAQDIGFTGLGDGTNWSDIDNWEGQNVPNNDNENAIIDEGGAFVVVLDGNFTVRDLIIGQDDELQIVNGRDFLVGGPIIENSNLIKMQSTSTTTSLVFQFPNVMLSGNGRLEMSDQFENRIFGGILTHGPDHVISGSGQLGAGSMGLINHGLIEANQLTPLRIQPADVDVGNGADVLNDGTFLATNGGRLELAGRLDNISGLIRADVGSEIVLLTSAEIEGGTFESIGTGRIAIPNSLDPTFRGTITNNAQVRQMATGSSTDARMQHEATIVGNGTWRMSNSINNRFLGTSVENVFTNGENHTIAGSGQICANLAGLINLGIIVADQETDLTIDPSDVDLGAGSADVVNGGTLKASSGGKLKLQFGRFDNVNGLILAEDESFVSLGTGAEIDGGLLMSLGSGRIIVENGQDPIFRGIIQNDSQIEQRSMGSSTDLRIRNGTVLSGIGTWKMTNNSPANRIIGTSPTSVLTHDIGHTIRGSGQIGANAMGLINHGNIIADADAGITIDPFNVNLGGGIDVLNEMGGLLHAAGEGGFSLVGGEFLNGPGGEIVVESIVNVASSATLENAEFGLIKGNGFLKFSSASGSLLSEGIVAPGLEMGILNICGNYDQLPTGILEIEIESANTFDSLFVEDNANLNGRLVVVLSNEFAPGPTDEFCILDAGQIAGDFSNVIDGKIILDGGKFDVITDTDSIVLTNYQTILPGDINNDGVANLLDVAPFVALISSGRYQCEADLNFDGEVNLLDVTPFVSILTG